MPWMRIYVCRVNSYSSYWYWGGFREDWYWGKVSESRRSLPETLRLSDKATSLWAIVRDGHISRSRIIRLSEKGRLIKRYKGVIHATQVGMVAGQCTNCLLGRRLAINRAKRKFDSWFQGFDTIFQRCAATTKPTWTTFTIEICIVWKSSLRCNFLQ